MTELEIKEVLHFISREGGTRYADFKDEIGNDFIYTLVTNKMFYLALALLKDLKHHTYDKGYAKLLCRVNKNRETGKEETLPLTAYKNGDEEQRVIRFYINFMDEIFSSQYDVLLDVINGNEVNGNKFDFRYYYGMGPLQIMEYIQKHISDFKEILRSTTTYKLIKAFLCTDALKEELAAELIEKITISTNRVTQVMYDGLLDNLLDLYIDEREFLDTRYLYNSSVDFDFYKLLTDNVASNERFNKTYLDEESKEYTPFNIILNNLNNPKYVIALVRYLVMTEKVDENIMRKTLIYLFSNCSRTVLTEVYKSLVQSGSIDNFMNLFDEEIIRLLSYSVKNVGVDATRSEHYEKVMKLIIKRMISELYIKFNNKNYTVDTTTIVNSYNDLFGTENLADKIYADFLDNFLKMKNVPSLNLDDISQKLFDKYCKDKSKVIMKKMYYN